MINVKLGNVARDAATGFTGTVEMISWTLGGNIHVILQPSCEEGANNELRKSEEFDHHLVDFVSDGIADRVCPPDDVEPLELGKRYRDKITGFTGIAVIKVASLQGCMQYGLTPKMADDDSGKYPNSIYFDHKRLDLIDDGIVGEIKDSAPGCIRRTDRPQSSHRGRQG